MLFRDYLKIHYTNCSWRRSTFLPFSFNSGWFNLPLPSVLSTATKSTFDPNKDRQVLNKTMVWDHIHMEQQRFCWSALVMFPHWHCAGTHWQFWFWRHCPWLFDLEAVRHASPLKPGLPSQCAATQWQLLFTQLVRVLKLQEARPIYLSCFKLLRWTGARPSRSPVSSPEGKAVTSPPRKRTPRTGRLSFMVENYKEIEVMCLTSLH